MHLSSAADLAAARFADCVGRVVAGQMSAVDLIGHAEALGRAGYTVLSRQLYALWVRQNPADPLLHAVQFNYGVLLGDAGEQVAANAAFAEATRLAPDFMPPYINLGSGFERLGDRQAAVVQWLQVVGRLAGVTGDAVLHKTTALKQIGRVLEDARELAAAEDMLAKGLEIDPGQRDVAQHWVSLRQSQCKWPAVAPWGPVTRDALMGAISPLSLAVHADDPLFQLANAHAYCRSDVLTAGMGTAGQWPPPEAPRTRPLRVGYLSPDLREHAVGFLTAEVYGLHDRAAVEVFAYYSGVRSPDATQARIRGAVDQWRDLSGLDDKAAAALVVADGIDILVDLGGYTKDVRTKLLALRPAPVIVNWLGFPGSMGSPHHHYIVADGFTVPEGWEHYYSETVLRLPCYQPNDRRRVVAPHRPGRAEAGLPEDAVVFCCFNGTQKIAPATFGRWMEVLRRVPGSVLWLLSGDPATEARLRALAAEAGVAADRIVFAARKPNAEHLARYGLADLFLDTFPYGAHTTASDAMWMGVPVLTLAGLSFASRVCGSLIHAAGMPELVCGTAAEYVDRAVVLGLDRAALRALRTRLAAGRDGCILFDTPALVRGLEALYARMWDEYAAGRLPRPDLSNLDAYAAIGAATDHEAGTVRTRPDYEAQYRTALAYRDGQSPLRPDARLWQDGAPPGRPSTNR